MQPQNLLSYVTVRILEWRDLLKINCLRATTNTIYSKTRWWWWWRWRWKWHWRRGGEFCDNSTTLPKHWSSTISNACCTKYFRAPLLTTWDDQSFPYACPFFCFDFFFVVRQEWMLRTSYSLLHEIILSRTYFFFVKATHLIEIYYSVAHLKKIK